MRFLLLAGPPCTYRVIGVLTSSGNGALPLVTCGGNIGNNRGSVAGIVASNVDLAQYAMPRGFNDFDIIEVGNDGPTAAEERAHFGH